MGSRVASAAPLVRVCKVRSIRKYHALRPLASLRRNPSLSTSRARATLPKRARPTPTLYSVVRRHAGRHALPHSLRLGPEPLEGDPIVHPRLQFHELEDGVGAHQEARLRGDHDLERRARRPVGPDLRQALTQFAQVPHPLDLVVGQPEGLVPRLHRLGELPLQHQDRAEVGAGHRLDITETQVLRGSDHRFGQRAAGGEVALAPQHPRPTEPAPEDGDHVTRGLAGLLRRRIAGIGRRPLGLKSAETGGEQGNRRELSGGNPRPVAPRSQTENLERLGQTSFMFEEIRVSGEAEPEPDGGLPSGRDSLQDAHQVRGLGQLRGKVRQVSPHRVHLPRERLAALVVGGALVQAVHQSRRHVRGERQARRNLAVVIAFDPGTLQEGGMPKHVSRRPDLVEELFGGEQALSFQVGGPG